MKKEVLIAIIVGFIIGLIATVILHTVRNGNGDEIITPTPSAGSNLDDSVDTSHSITLSSPQLNQLFTVSELLVKGFTSPDSHLSIINENNQVLAIADGQGAFSIPVELEGGPNTFTITSFNTDGEMAEATFSATFSTAKISEDKETSNDDASTEEEATDE